MIFTKVIEKMKRLLSGSEAMTLGTYHASMSVVATDSGTPNAKEVEDILLPLNLEV